MPNRMTPDLLWKLPRVGKPVPDADGRRLIVPVTTWDVEANKSTARLWLKDTHGTRALTGEGSASNPQWSPDGETLLFLRRAPADDNAIGAEKSQIYRLPLSGGEPEKLTDMPLGVDDALWFPDGKRIAFVSGLHQDHLTIDATVEESKRRAESKVKVRASSDRFYRFWDDWVCDAPWQHFWSLDLATGEVTDLTPAMERFLPLMGVGGSWHISPDGDEIAFTANRTERPYHEMFMGVFRLKLEGSEPQHITDWPCSSAGTPRFSPNGKWIVYTAQQEQGFYADKQRVVAHDRDSGKHLVLTEPWDRSGSQYDFIDDKTLLIIAEDRGANAVYTLDFERAVNSPGEVEPQQVARGGWYDGVKIAGGRLFTTKQGIASPSETVSLKLDGTDERVESEFTRPLLAEAELGEFEEHYFKGAEGHDVQMWLLYPPGKKGEKNLPLLHLIHGGPHGVFGDQWHWRWCSQVFANAGYLCAMVNFHGSTSWGNEFAKCILTEWGKKPYEDIIAATDYLIEKGLADPDRTACAGGSYGGYMTAWIAGQTDRFKCLVNHAGVSDLQAQFARDVTPNREKALGGEPWGNQEGMDRYNPIRHSKGFKIPMLVLHGEKDYRVPYTQALETYNAYMAQQQEARLVVYEDENHWILKPQSSLHWWGEVLGWLKRYLG